MSMLFNKEGAVGRMRELVAARAPFLHQGRTFDGIDCVGAVVYAFQYTGVVPPYPEDPINGELEAEITRVFGEPILQFDSENILNAPSLLRSGDIVTMQYAGPTRHVAVIATHPAIAGKVTVIHTDAMLGRVTEHLLDFKWMRRIVKVWRP